MRSGENAASPVEELVVFDILTRPEPELTTEERAEVKRVARELLARLKRLLVLGWRHKAAARSRPKLAIEDNLDAGPPHRRQRGVTAGVRWIRHWGAKP